MILFLDPGHGGIDPATGRYTTAPAKQFKHAEGEYHREGWFFEGVYNRAQAAAVTRYAEEAGLTVELVAHPWKDTPLRLRTEKANFLPRAGAAAVFLSLHANAAPVPGLARGFEVFFFQGSRAGQELATLIARNVAADPLLSELFLMRGVKQGRFHVLRETRMPAVLVEHGFFDHPHDAAAMLRQDVQDAFARAEVEAIMEWKNNTDDGNQVHS